MFDWFLLPIALRTAVDFFAFFIEDDFTPLFFVPGSLRLGDVDLPTAFTNVFSEEKNWQYWVWIHSGELTFVDQIRFTLNVWKEIIRTLFHCQLKDQGVAVKVIGLCQQFPFGYFAKHVIVRHGI